MATEHAVEPLVMGCGSIDLRKVEVRPVRPGEVTRWNELMAERHYLGFRCLVGESLKYVAHVRGTWVALLGWGCAAFKSGPRERWIGWSPDQHWQRLHLVTNNQRFLVLPDTRVPNLASRVLALNLKRLSEDWRAVYGHPVVLAETFVDPDRHRGTCYRAAGWSVLGETRGFRRHAGRYYHHGHPKTLLVKSLHPEMRRLLCAPFLAPELTKDEVAMVDLNSVNIDNDGGLLDHLKALPDPRKPRGMRHKLRTVLAVAICACLSGSRSLAAIAEWIAQQPRDILRRLGCRRKGSGFIVPSEPTIRRVLQRIDADKLDEIAGEWLSQQSDGKGVAIDGKALRGSGNAKKNQVHLLSALLHKEGIAVSQREVDKKSNEITAAEPLLEPLELKGKVVTADAMHTQTKLARYLVEDKHADYLFQVKENQPGLLRDIQDLDASDFFPSLPNPR